ncbi:LmeA family phospholipid-binding protein [Lacisediminihabitans changchengi]|uniref:DUF2993 domain-containing protein n=1 Tax=Lacisediminihabitans changchengi TaxID=2787634 RepID=A0A934W224_9MICO|nr:DUF2993 domain-containing protein [Lacisediminihabitans changchengi]MBK4347478.1 DUF2993 domain-containing protein [Lacisediminihabitans changchengi]
MTESIETIEIIEVAPVKRRRRRWPIVLAVVVVVLIVVVVVADFVARGFAERLIADKARTALGVSASTPLEVTVGGGPVLLQAAGGKLDDVRIEAPGLSVGDLRGDAVLTVHGVPFDQSKPLDTADLRFSTDDTGLSSLISGLTKGQDLPVTISGVTIAKGAVQLATEVPVFGAKIPAAIAVAPGAKGGQITLTPTSFSISGATFTPADVSKNLGTLGTELAQTRTICVANQLPKGFRLESLRVSGSDLVLGVTAKSVVLGSELFHSKGSCP